MALTIRRIVLAQVAALSGLLLVFSLLIGSGSATAETTGNLPGGTSISVDIANPADGTLVADPPGAFNVDGTAEVGEGEPVKDTTLVFTMDRSGSMGLDAGVDCTGNGSTDTRMVCQKEGVVAGLQAAADPQSTVGLVGLASFSDDGTAHDIDRGAMGTQLLVPPTHDGDGDGTPDVEQEARLVSVGGGTSYGTGLQKTADIIHDPANTSGNNSVIFMSDGLNNRPPDVTTVGIPSATNIQSFALGTGVDCSDDPDGFGSLDEVAGLSTAGTGDCEEVTDMSTLAAAIEESRGSTLDAVDISVDGGTFQPVASPGASLPEDGPTSTSYSHAISGLAPGVHEICVRATGTDAGGEGSVSDCIEVTVADLSLTPDSATNELTGSDDEHTVTATVAPGTDDGVENVDVSFEILSGPNAGESAVATTNTDGEATFTYSAVQGPSGLGTDTIEACFIDDLGNQVCDEATKDWVDTTPPAVACEPTENPSGNQEPQGGKKSPGQNEDGFYELTADDAVDPDPELFVRDTGSGTEFGPFADGTKIKYTEANGAEPRQKEMGGPDSDVDWHIIGNGDAEVFAVDDSGNESDPVECLVPEPPK